MKGDDLRPTQPHLEGFVDENLFDLGESVSMSPEAGSTDVGWEHSSRLVEDSLDGVGGMRRGLV